MLGMIEKTYISHALVCILGVFGILLIRWFCRRNTYLARILIVCWAMAFVLLSEGSAGRVYYSATVLMETSYASMILTIALTSLFGGGILLVFVWLGMVHFWPGKNIPLGYPLKRETLPSLALGVAVGWVAAIVVSPDLTIANPLVGISDFPLLGLFVLPLVIMEEAVFRGRLMEVLQEKIGSAGLVLVVQALIFTATHIPKRLAMMSSIGVIHLLINALIILVLGLVYGFLRQRSGNLWASTASHAVYNAFVIAMVFHGG